MADKKTLDKTQYLVYSIHTKYQQMYEQDGYIYIAAPSPEEAAEAAASVISKTEGASDIRIISVKEYNPNDVSPSIELSQSLN